MRLLGGDYSCKLYVQCIYDLYLESIGEESVVEESVGDDELDHDNDEVEELTENETTKVNIVSEMKMFHHQSWLSHQSRGLLIVNVAAEKLN